MPAGFALRADPDWTAAARDLVAGLARQEDAESRIALMEHVCTGLGDALYPAFLEILHVVAHRGEVDDRRRVAAALVDGLVTGRLPSGRLAAWGGATLAVHDPFGRPRSLGPIEFACAWFAQPNQLPPLARERFDRVLASLVALVSTHPPAAALYAATLAAEADDPTPGALAGNTRAGLAALARAWGVPGVEADATRAARLVAVFHDAIAPVDLLALAAREAPPELGR